MKLISQPFENSVTEEWVWSTNSFISANGTEQRVSLLDPPRRTMQPTWQFVDAAASGRALRVMYGMQLGLQVPAFQHSTKIAAAAAGDTEIGLASIRTELRNGDAAFVYDPRTDAYEVVSIVNVTDSEVTLTAPLAANWPVRSRIAPLWAFVASDNAVLTRGRMGDANVSMSLVPLGYVDPFLNPENDIELDLFSGLPVNLRMPIGSDFSLSFNNGSTINDYGGAINIRSLWQHTQEAFARTYLCQKTFNRTDWQWWNKFADYCKGSLNPFYLPTQRPDFELLAQDATHVTLQGTDYNGDFFPFAPFKQFAFYDASGALQMRSATASGIVAGNSHVTFDPALPDGFVIATVSLLLKVRIADDKVSVVHDPIQATITLNMRTVDE